MPQRVALRLAAVCLGLAAAWLACEGLVLSQGRDLAAIRRVLYYQTTELALFTPTDAPLLHYTPRPGGALNQTTIGPTGLRNPTPPDDASGLRILFGGGSTVFGVQIRDAETLPARLAHHLGGGAAVWNLGASAYVEAQVLERSRQWLEQLGDIDLILVMITNPGRRPVLGGAPMDRPTLRRHLWHDPGFTEENLPPPWGLRPGGLHRMLLRRSPTWRYVTAVQAGQLSPDAPQWDPSVARDLAAARLREAAQAHGATVVYVEYPRNALPCPGCWRGDATVSLTRPGLRSADTDLHPPAAVLDAHAAALAEKLRAAGLISTNR